MLLPRGLLTIHNFAVLPSLPGRVFSGSTALISSSREIREVLPHSRHGILKQRSVPVPTSLTTIPVLVPGHREKDGAGERRVRSVISSTRASYFISLMFCGLTSSRAANLQVLVDGVRPHSPARSIQTLLTIATVPTTLNGTNTVRHPQDIQKVAPEETPARYTRKPANTQKGSIGRKTSTV